ncbi:MULTISPECIES: hypothetical protein [Bacteroides]|uniref:Uncharacterized protein n=1 Tax=Bacteroides clarus TaxID=626929 RepID=A0A1Y3YM47_9BACE|nr:MULTISPECIES: hypothetical protein [Bacteroides]MBD9145669.1 hypothetical protein [Bacteroides clarus]MBS7574326.1 hypothetical protein [Bacteroides propionicigenes]OUN98952.1 hypothetical protein B5F97_16575 [Bacteroides clarus]RGM25297.1 hypothetical protein DXC20_14995 [Bacteroides sp. OM08-17BH]HBO05992.1 hypothetical protein [Bacteroides sp.]
MKPETAYKLVERFSLTNATIMTIFFAIHSDSLWTAFCTIVTVPVIGIAMMAMYESSANGYTELMKNLTEKDKKAMSDVPWDKVIKEARNRYLMGLIGIMFCNILLSGLIIFFLWIIIYEGRTVVFRL